MDVQQFVKQWRSEKDQMLDAYLHPISESEVSRRIASLDLNETQLSTMRQIVDGILTDAFYSLLLGLDGSSSIGGIQQPYEIRDENGEVISRAGELESEAWKQFHGDAA